MADSSSNPFQNRSISLPTGSNPILDRVEECLRNVRGSKPRGLSGNGLSLLRDLYRSAGDFLRMIQTQQALKGKEKSVSKLVDDLLKLLEVCGILKDSLVQMREQQQSLLSMIRRRDLNLAAGICKYQCLRRKTKKDMAKNMQLVKNMDLHSDSSEEDKVQQVLREVRTSTVSVLQILVSVVTLPNSPKRSPVLMSKFRLLSSKKAAAAGGDDEEGGNEIEMLDEALFTVNGGRHSGFEIDEFGVESARRIMEGLEDCLREVEDGLEGLSRCMINARVNLLNILTCC